MRFYALVAAFTAVLISHEVNAAHGLKKVVAMKTRIGKFEDSLNQYKNNRSIVSIEEQEKSAIGFAESRIADIVQIYKTREVQGEDLENCHQKLKSDVDEKLLHHRKTMEMCLKRSRMEGLVGGAIQQLQINGHDLLTDLKYIESCKTIRDKANCLRQGPEFRMVKDKFKKWKKIVKALIHNRHQVNVEETTRRDNCLTESYDTFANSLLKLENIARQLHTVAPGSGYMSC